MKFYGPVGFTEEVEKRRGVTIQEPVEYNYGGDVLKRSVKYQNGESVNDNLNVQHQISILADPYARKHFYQIKYVKWMGAAWKVTDVSVQYPRLILTLGGVYNGATVDGSAVDGTTAGT